MSIFKESVLKSKGYSLFSGYIVEDVDKFSNAICTLIGIDRKIKEVLVTYNGRDDKIVEEIGNYGGNLRNFLYQNTLYNVYLLKNDEPPSFRDWKRIDDSGTKDLQPKIKRALSFMSNSIGVRISLRKRKKFRIYTNKKK